MARTARDRQRQERDQQRQRAAADKAAKAARTRRIVGGGVVLMLLLATVGAVIAATAEDPGTTTTTTTSTSLPGDSTAPESPPVDEVPLPPPGEALGTDYPCPAEDGSAPRVTDFGGPPPTCIATTPDGAIDTAIRYRATMATDAGDMVFLLNTEQAPQTVNDFVVLSRYHYFDGAPFDTVVTRNRAEIGGAFEGVAPASPAGGFTLPGEAPEVGTIAFPTALFIAPADAEATESQGGRFLLAIGDQAADLPPRTTQLGLLLDGVEAFQRLTRAGTTSGVPSDVITVASVRIEVMAPEDAPSETP